MNAAPSDPQVPTRALAGALGVPVLVIQRGRRDGLIPPGRRGFVPLLAGLRAILAQIKAGADGPAPALPPIPVLPKQASLPDLDHTLDAMVTDLDRALDRLRSCQPASDRGPSCRAHRAMVEELDALMRRAKGYRRNVVQLVKVEADHGCA